ncbi:MAG: pro-sigmaK processing inhibitor BofA family protein [Clostridia bacterium]|nr:pro-sigmaK processing inhibitor BofA family protein [Clostridia bacterium]
MEVWHLVTAVLVTFLLFSLIYKIAKKKKPLRRAFLTMLSGVLSLILVDITGVFTGVYLPVSPLSLTVSSCAGVPGVATMLIISWLL